MYFAQRVHLHPWAKISCPAYSIYSVYLFLQALSYMQGGWQIAPKKKEWGWVINLLSMLLLYRFWFLPIKQMWLLLLLLIQLAKEFYPVGSGVVIDSLFLPINTQILAHSYVLKFNSQETPTVWTVPWPDKKRQTVHSDMKICGDGILAPGPGYKRTKYLKIILSWNVKRL